MFIELIDGLRCINDHPSICLVASIIQRDDRQVIEGVLGCPTCRREYTVRDGIAWFGSQFPETNPRMPDVSPDPEAVLRTGAYLAVSEGMTIALVGSWAENASGLSELAGLRAFAVNPTNHIVESERVAVLYSDNRLPFREGSLHGVAIDESGWSADDIARAARMLSPGGRMVAPATAQLPEEIDEIARDDEYWVGEKRGALVALHRR